jgi:hypothetical protein
VPAAQRSFIVAPARSPSRATHTLDEWLHAAEYVALTGSDRVILCVTAPSTGSSIIDRFLALSCVDLDCEECRHCHQYADRAVKIDPRYREEVLALYRDLFGDLWDGSFFERPRAGEFVAVGRLAARAARDAAAKVFPSLATR